MKILIILLFSFNAFASLNFEEFKEVKVAVAKAFLELRPSEKHSLAINQAVGDNEHYWWDLEATHASYSGYEQDGLTKHHIFLFGGFARLKGMTKDGLAVTACHEIAHGIGGEPLKVTGNTSEGQADYYATKSCLEIVFKYLKIDELSIRDNYIKDLCQRESNNIKFCLRAMSALKSDIEFFETLGDTVDFNRHSSNIATELNSGATYYPDSQCRLDTMIHGVLDLERPRCWYPKGIERRL